MVPALILNFSVFYLVLCSIGGNEGVGEDGLGFGEQVLGLFEAGADMGEQQLFGMGFQGEGGGLCGGAVQFLGCHGGESGVEGAFEAEQVDALDVGEDGLGVGGVGAVGIAAGWVFAARLLLDEVAVGGHGMHEGEGMDAAAAVVEEAEAAFGVLQLVIAYLKFGMAAGDLHDGVHGCGDALGGKDIDGLCATAEVHAADEAGKAEEVVAVQVGEAYCG